MSLKRAHSLALRAEFMTDEGQRTGSEKQLRAARQLHAQASREFKEAGDERQARYHQRKAKELYYEIHRHDPDPSDPYHRGARENPVFLGLSGTDILLFAGGIAAVGLVGYLIWNQQQANQEAAVAAANGYTPGVAPAPSPTSSAASQTLANASVLYAANGLVANPAPVLPPNPNAAGGASPLPTAPS